MRVNNEGIIFVLGLVLALVSIVCEVMLFVDYAQTYFDKFLAALTAAALVGCQFAFVGVAVNLWGETKVFKTGFLFLVIGVLFFISVSGTASFYESRFSGEEQTAIKNSVEYETQKGFVSDYRNQASAFMVASLAASEEGNSSDAGWLLKQSQQATQNSQQAAEKLLLIQPQDKTSGAALVALTGQGRWWLWYAIAALVDVCPLLCFAIYTGRKKQSVSINKTLKEIETPKTIEAPTENKTVDVKNKKEKMALKIVEIQERIKTGEFGETPGVRQVMRETGIKSNPLIKMAFNELELQNVIEQCPTKKTYKLISAV